MTTATRNSQYTRTTSETSQVLYLAFELGVEEWKIGFTKALGTKPRVRVMPARDLTRLAREITAAKQWFALPANAAVRSCYEAGRDGFWLHRHLATVGIDNQGGRLVEHRGESTPATCEVRRVGRAQITGDAAPVSCGRVEGVERCAGSHCPGGRSAAVAPRTADVDIRNTPV